MKKIKHYVLNLVLPIFYYGAVTGILTAALVTLYKWCAVRVIDFSFLGYSYLRQHLYLLAIAVPALFGVALLLWWIYKKLPNLRGGGIPTSIGVVRGLITFKWLRTLLGVFALSMCSFVLGVPLGNEGPSVQMGTAMGGATVAPMRKNQKAWGRYAMTGGACAGFATATGAPISGILFAVEEAHERISPIILLIATVSVVFGKITSELLCPLLGVSGSLFSLESMPAMGLDGIWLPIVIGLTFGTFAVLFLNYHKFIRRFLRKTLAKMKGFYKIFAVLLLTLGLGLVSTSFISTGHAFTENLFDARKVWYSLLIIFLVRSTLTLLANSSGITGGIFLPTLAIGASLAGLLAELLIGGFGLAEEYYLIILVLGITACIAGMMKMPITAIVFAVEALSCYSNVLYVIVAVAVTFIITEIFSAPSINDSVLHTRLEEQNAEKQNKVVEGFFVVQAATFAIGKQIRDVLWPANTFVLSVAKNNAAAEADGLGERVLHEGDVLHIRYLTYDEEKTMREIFSIVGEQDVKMKTVKKV